MATMRAREALPQDLAALVSASPHADLLLSAEFTIAAASGVYLELIGLPAQAVVGQDIRQHLAGSPALADLVSSLEAAVRSGARHRIGPGLFRLPGRRECGERMLEVVNAPVPATDGSVAWIIQSVREAARLDDATGADRVARAAAEARLRSILETVPDAMVIIDERGRIESLSATAEKLFGYTLAESAGRNISLFMPEPHRSQHDHYLERYLRTGEKHIIGIGRIVVGQRRDGTTFPMHLTIGELQSADRHYFTGFIRDLTDQELTENRLKELQAEVAHMSRFTALGEMASTLAHEINQPLTAINNYLRGCHRLLQRAEGEQMPALRDALAKAADQALRAGQIIRRLREFVARGDSERQVESLPRLIEDASTLALVGTHENAIAVSFRLDPRAELVVVDRIQIQQVLVNLIRNAVEILLEAPGPRALGIETMLLDDGLVQVSVTDSGAGLAPEVRAHLFQPFVTTKQKGMGLGLSICRTIVEAHGGKIWVEPRPQGGTIFRFTLRMAEETEEAELGR